MSGCRVAVVGAARGLEVFGCELCIALAENSVSSNAESAAPAAEEAAPASEEGAPAAEEGAPAAEEAAPAAEETAMKLGAERHLTLEYGEEIFNQVTHELLRRYPLNQTAIDCGW